MSDRKPKLDFAISGFPEFAPEARDIERRWMETLAELFESYGYANIETPSVETVRTLASKGEDVDKEIYALTRLAAEAGDTPKYALHYDLTVPTARYVAKHYSELSFPFKRYQIQRAWRGERPQEGRFREFTQCDIDVIDNETVSLGYDYEMLEMAVECLRRLDTGPVRFQVSNRRIMDGLAAHLGLSDATLLARILDKVDKMPADKMGDRLTGELGLDAAGVDTCLAFTRVRGGADAVSDGLDALGLNGSGAAEGREALCELLARIAPLTPEGWTIEGDLSISRGFDYYTGVVYEARFVDYPGYPSICAGGRYENLVGSFMRRRLPGVGISIGLTRIFTKLLKEGRLEAGRSTPTEILLAWETPPDNDEAYAMARRIRAAGVNVEWLPDVPRLDRQMRYANDKGIPKVWITRDDGQVLRDMKTGEQVDIDLESFLAARGE